MLFIQEDLHDVIILGDKKVDQAPELEVGKVYNAFDDGKISYTRLIEWKIIEAIDLDNENKLDNEVLSELGKEISSCYWLYSPEQRIIYKAKMIDDSVEYCYFLRTKQGGWFGALSSWFNSELDYDGSLLKMLEGGK